MLGIIYCYTSPENKKYIGQTTDKDRLSKHLYLCKKGLDIPFYNAIRKYGIENFKFEILYSKECDNKEKLEEILNNKEKYYIKRFNTYQIGYNCSLGGKGNLGYRHTKKTKEKLSLLTKTQWENENFRELVTQVNKDKKLSDETKEKISKTSKAHWKNPLYIKKMETRNTKKVLCIETGIVFDSVKECALKMNINKNNISQVCRNERKKAKGFSFVYV